MQSFCSANAASSMRVRPSTTDSAMWSSVTISITAPSHCSNFSMRSSMVFVSVLQARRVETCVGQRDNHRNAAGGRAASHPEPNVVLGGNGRRSVPGASRASTGLMSFLNISKCEKRFATAQRRPSAPATTMT